MNWHDIVYDPGSTTKAFKVLAADYKLDVFFSGFFKNVFKRTIEIKLDNIPVMLAVSTTKATNELFLDILQNAGRKPIGLRLFAEDSDISRGDMAVNEIALADISDSLVTKYLNSIKDIDKLYLRQSVFSYKDETMSLDEYILPGLQLVIDKYNL